MSDADDRFVESLAAELTPLVGPRLRVSADRPRATGRRSGEDHRHPGLVVGETDR